MDDEVTDEVGQLGSWEFDVRDVVIRLVPDQMGEPVEIWTAGLWEPRSGPDLPLDVMAELAVALRAGGAPPAYILRTSRTYVEWGASAISEDVILEVARWGLEGIAGTIAYNALRGTLARLARARRPESQPLSADEAAERGRWRIQHAFKLFDEEGDRLVVVGGDELADGSRVVRYQLDDRRYEAEFVESDGLVTIVRVGWDRPSDPATPDLPGC